MLVGAIKPTGNGVGSGSLFQSTAWHLFQNMTILLAVTFWLGTVWWVFRDARRRIADPWIVAFATLLSLVPFVGALLYLLVRPLEPLTDARERELEMRVLQRRLDAGHFCSQCGADSDPEFRFCPQCAAELKKACAGCTKLLDARWVVCPFCGVPAVAEPAALVEVLTPTASQRSSA